MKNPYQGWSWRLDCHYSYYNHLSKELLSVAFQAQGRSAVPGTEAHPETRRLKSDK